MKRRTTVKKVDRRWRVYDTLTGSFPYQRKGVGQIKQDLPTEAAAWEEADRLERLLTDQTTEEGTPHPERHPEPKATALVT